MRRFTIPIVLCLGLVCAASGAMIQDDARAARTANKPAPPEKTTPAKQNAAKALSPAEELQKAIGDAGNDRAELVRNLKAYLEKYPEAAQRPQIYRALVEACVQFKDDACATDYAERIVALTPDDISMTLLAVQLLERNGDQAALRRAVTYVTRVSDSVKSTPISEKSPRVSLEEWDGQKKRDESALLALRGRLEGRLNDAAAARKDYDESYALQPNASAALKLGELDELAKNYEGAATEYARAFALSETAAKSVSRREIREKLGNAWRLAHGNETGLGDFLLKTIDSITAVAAAPRPLRNDGVKDPFAFVVRRAPEGTPYPVAPLKGKVLVINFWATWCGPCHALEPIYERLAARNAGNPELIFLSANCDQDESLVGPYLAERPSKTTEVFADRLEELFNVESFPTVLILDGSGKVAFRVSGFDPQTIEAELNGAIRRIVGTVAAKNVQPAAVY
ncbi:MAG TPA: thioredoxin domain-containing protein [Candidatus Eisenbacteria bacterium]|jgi:thiol-disulfide isomerase/thioredoxin|nr:thioredoxin domain-containing protein [Candidatus Eisenbacteria bacterium]